MLQVNGNVTTQPLDEHGPLLGSPEQTLGTRVLDALFQSPIILARRPATLDRFSDGRLVVGVGQGGMEQKFEAAGVSMKRRGAGFEEHILAMRAVWSPDLSGSSSEFQ
jgi:alkanesulfonate monooxygenase SsuD/methylene tetrahydromethanopterin reductase-like flavin-dependent oxidoreductase (luciferase family)